MEPFFKVSVIIIKVAVENLNINFGNGSTKPFGYKGVL